MLIIDRDTVRQLLDDAQCIALIREAMIALSAGETRQLPRQIVALANGLFGVMPGALGGAGAFGAKVLSVFPGNVARGGQSHQGGIMLFDGDSGAPTALVHAGEVTAIRTAAASAVATDALARADATRLAILGAGEQAEAHLRALRLVRPFAAVTIWARDHARAAALARHGEAAFGLACTVADSAAAAVRDADVICTVTGAQDPILLGRDVPCGAHVNLVGSSYAGPSEADEDLVASARFFGDSRDHVLAQGAEFIRAREAGRIDDAHFLGEIGAVLAGRVTGRSGADDITIYKSLGHIVQDLAGAAHVAGRAAARGLGISAPFL